MVNTFPPSPSASSDFKGLATALMCNLVKINDITNISIEEKKLNKFSIFFVIEFLQGDLHACIYVYRCLCV